MKALRFVAIFTFVFLMLAPMSFGERPQMIFLGGPPWNECSKDGSCFFDMEPGQQMFFLWDADNELYTIGPFDTKNNFARLAPEPSEKFFVHSFDAEAELRYCSAGAECLGPDGLVLTEDDPPELWMVGKGRLIANYKGLYDEYHGGWWIGPGVINTTGTVYDKEGNAFDLVSLWHYLPSKNNPAICTDDGQYCWPCILKYADISILPVEKKK